jgi:diaminohydroxyphosphoribosylaminopyrimidine deaminase/5-amino-6-(5-phosphoribosylamino)uracil reductase
MKRTFPNEEFMKMAISLAKTAEGKTHPNPCVGAVVVKNGKAIGKGFYTGFGNKHAEVEAIKDAKGEVKGADLYVTLEPCQIYGKTPPCTKLIIESQIKRVIAGAKDPNPKINGKGFEELKKNGVEVIEDFLKKECIEVDKAYHIFHTKNRPFVHLKWAQSIDGATALPDGGYLSGEDALENVHRQRFLSDAILVTSSTIKRDKPQLTIRKYTKTKPLLRLIVDIKGIKTLPQNFKKTAENGGEIIVFRPSSLKNLPQIKGRNISTVVFDCRADYKDIFYEILKFLRKRQIVSLYVEAVGGLSATMIEENLVDKISVDVAMMLLGRGESPSPLGFPLKKKVDFSNCQIEIMNRDLIFSLEVEGKCLRG